MSLARLFPLAEAKAQHQVVPAVGLNYADIAALVRRCIKRGWAKPPQTKSYTVRYLNAKPLEATHE